MSSLEELQRIRTIAITALVSDDDFMEILVLKGGNALDLIYGVAARSSSDLDFSIERAFSDDELEILPGRIQTLLETAFREEKFEVFDVEFSQQPDPRRNTHSEFWGGYKIVFKVISSEDFDRLGGDLELIRKEALSLGKLGRKSFEIDISSHEYVAPKQEHELVGYALFVYTPEMLMIEKLRAICQQMPEYSEVVNRKRDSGQRARDFFDICRIADLFNVDLTKDENLELVKRIFAAKKVPLELLGKIEDYREFHEPGFTSVIATLKEGIEINDQYDYYFDRVLGIVKSLEPLWIK